MPVAFEGGTRTAAVLCTASNGKELTKKDATKERLLGLHGHLLHNLLLLYKEGAEDAVERKRQGRDVTREQA